MNYFYRRWFGSVTCLALMSVLAVGAGAQKASSGNREKTAAVMPTWSKLQDTYAYDAKKPLHVKEEIKHSDTAYVVHVQVEGPDGKTAPGVFMRPKAEGVYPVVLLLHGLTSDKETMLNIFGKPMVEQGVAVLALDAPYHGERKDPKVDPWQPTVFPGIVQQGVREWRRGLDYLATRKDVDMKHVGLLGYSMGSMMGSILGGVDNRIGAFALCVGGDPILPSAEQVPAMLREVVYAVSPSLYIGHIAPRPVLMLNGKQDKTMQEPASKRLYEAAHEPKQQLWYDCGHILTPDAGVKAVTWVLEKVKPGTTVKLDASHLPSVR